MVRRVAAQDEGHRNGRDHESHEQKDSDADSDDLHRLQAAQSRRWLARTGVNGGLGCEWLRLWPSRTHGAYRQSHAKPVTFNV